MERMEGKEQKPMLVPPAKPQTTIHLMDTLKAKTTRH